MTTSSAMTSFDRRQLLKASGMLAIGFSMSRAVGSASAATLLAPKSVAKEAVDSWLTIGPDDRITIFCGKVDLGTGARPPWRNWPPRSSTWRSSVSRW